MLKQRELDTKSAGRFAFAAARDANRYSDECRMLYTAKERAQAETLCDIVTMAYAGKQVYITFRKTFISIKVDAPIVRDRKIVRELEEICTENGYVKARSAQGLAYQIPNVA